MSIRGVVAAGSLLVGMFSVGGCSSEPAATLASQPAPLETVSAVGYEGWWDATPISGDTSTLPDQTIAVRTDTGEIVEASARDVSGQAAVIAVSDVEYTVDPGQEWPARSVVIIDTQTGEVLHSFPVDSKGRPTG